MKEKDFAVFILTHGRANTMVTYRALLKAGYTGKVYFIIDNEDKTAEDYINKYGKSNVIIFDKLKESKTTDSGDNFNNRKAIVYARNACFEIAKNLGVKYFLQLDDDYTDFRYKFNAKGEYGNWPIKNIDNILDILLDFYKKIPAKSIAMAQGGDFIGGGESSMSILKLRRKCMNTFLCSTERPFKYCGTMNEDVTTYTKLGSNGFLFFTLTNVAINQLATQSVTGGMTEVYKEGGTYIKSFYSIMYHPSSITVKLMGTEHKRLHHSVKWVNTVPLILNEKYKK